MAPRRKKTTEKIEKVPEGQEPNWDAAEAHYIAMNLSRGLTEPEYTLSALATALGITRQRVHRKAAKGRWREKMQQAMRHRTQVGIEAAQDEAEINESHVRRQQVRRARVEQDIAMLALERIYARMKGEPEYLPDPSVLRAFDRLMRTGLIEERAALGLTKVVDIKETMHDQGPLAALAEHQELEGLAADLIKYIQTEAGEEEEIDVDAGE